jgi:hypothetical protein
MNIEKKIQNELEKLNPLLSSHLRSYEVNPHQIFLEREVNPDATIECWIAFKKAAHDIGIAYSEQGHGPKNPWGLVWLSGKRASQLGADYEWFASLGEAFLDSGMADDLMIWCVYRQSDASSPLIEVSEPSDNASSWKKLAELKALDTKSRFHCKPSKTLIEKL